MTSPEESVLLAQARKNDQEAFAALAERYAKALENIVLPLVGDRDAARDIVRETVFRAQRKLHLYREQYRFSTWFFRIGVNLAITNRRRRLLEQRLLVSEGVRQADERAERQLSGLDQLLQSEDVERLRAAMRKLPARWQEVLAMRYHEDLDVQEIARRTKSSANSVSIVIHRAKERLKELLQPS